MGNKRGRLERVNEAQAVAVTMPVELHIGLLKKVLEMVKRLPLTCRQGTVGSETRFSCSGPRRSSKAFLYLCPRGFGLPLNIETSRHDSHTSSRRQAIVLEPMLPNQHSQQDKRHANLA